MIGLVELSFCQTPDFNLSKNLQQYEEGINNNQTKEKAAYQINYDKKTVNENANNDDNLKKRTISISLLEIGNDPRIRTFFKKTYSVINIYCKRNRISKRKLYSEIISEIY